LFSSASSGILYPLLPASGETLFRDSDLERIAGEFCVFACYFSLSFSVCAASDKLRIPKGSNLEAMTARLEFKNF
jgi:hypothetical protein